MYITEGITHDGGPITVLSVVVEDLLDRLDTEGPHRPRNFAGGHLLRIKDLERLCSYIQISKLLTRPTNREMRVTQPLHKQRLDRTRREG